MSKLRSKSADALVAPAQVVVNYRDAIELPNAHLSLNQRGDGVVAALSLVVPVSAGEFLTGLAL